MIAPCTIAEPAEADASPCTKTCVIDPVTGYCIGCGRTGDEIAQWPAMDSAERIAVKLALAARLRAMTSRAVRQGRRHARAPSR